MEHLIRGFTRVIRHVDDADSLISSFPGWEQQLSSPGSAGNFDDATRRRILDFPEIVTQTENIMKSSERPSKTELLHVATSSPQNLTDEELKLLRDRYWLDITRAELSAKVAGTRTLPKISQEYKMETLHRLERMRALLYEEHELDGIENAFKETYRRTTVDLVRDRQRKMQELWERYPPHHWLKKLWNEEHEGSGEFCPNRRWGFHLYVTPEVLQNEDVYQEFRCKKDMVLFQARTAIGCGSMATRWTMQAKDWPQDLSLEESSPNVSALSDCFASLRKDFKTNQRLKPVDSSVLTNVFLVIDISSMNSIYFGTGNVDDMYIWAVDPDFMDQSTNAYSSSYRGYFKVRLQQIVHRFFEARKYRSLEFSMEQLWEKAIESKNECFVSFHDDETKSWTWSRDTGSALRP